MARHTNDWKFIVIPMGGYAIRAKAKGKDTVEIHGGFETEAAAKRYAKEMRDTFSDYKYIEVVKIETTKV